MDPMIIRKENDVLYIGVWFAFYSQYTTDITTPPKIKLLSVPDDDTLNLSDVIVFDSLCNTSGKNEQTSKKRSEHSMNCI